MDENQKVLDSLAQGTTGSNGMDVAWTYYDRTKLTTGLVNYDYFTVPQGQSGKTIADSNFPLAGQLPVAQKLLVTHVGVQVYHDAVTTPAIARKFNNFLQNSVFSLIIQNKAPIFELAGSDIMNLAYDIIAQDAAVQTRTPMPIMTGQYKVAAGTGNPIVMASNTTFKVKAEFIGGVDSDLGDKTYLKFQLKGRLLRTT